MNRQEFYRQQYRSLRPDWTDSLTLYRELIDECTHADTWLLDIGCGHGDFLRSVYSKTKHAYGIDPDKNALARNTAIKNRAAGIADHLPFPHDVFDLVVSSWVLEHLDNPVNAFREAHRVLKPGGKVIFLTPNAWNYNVWIIRMIPNAFHDFFTRRLYNRQENDTYPVRYKINSIGTIDRVLTSVGFGKSRIILNGDPTYIGLNRPLFKVASAVERLLDTEPLQRAKVHIIGIYQKQSRFP